MDGPNRVKSTRMSLTAAFLALSVSIIGSIAAGTSEWFRVTWKAPKPTQSWGLFESCLGLLCKRNTYRNETCFDGKIVNGFDLEERFDGVASCMLVGILLSFIVCFVSLMSYKRRTQTVWVSVISCSVLSAASFGAGIAVFTNTMGEWLNCGKEYCSGRESALLCSASFGWSYSLACAALGLSVLTILVAALNNNSSPVTSSSMIKYSPRRSPLPPINISPKALPAGTASTGVSMPQEEWEYDDPNDPNSEKRYSEEEWEYDAQNHLYYSSAQRLYMDPLTGHYYDPNSEKWYDPDTEEWYTPEQR